MNAKLTLGIALTLAIFAAGAVVPTPASAACKNWGIPLAGAAENKKVSELLHAAAPTDSQSDDASIVGLWHVLFVSGGQPFDEGYDVWHSDGTEILNDTAPPQPANGAGTICLGVYKKTGLRSYKLRHPFWIFDATATLVGTGVFLENVTLNLTGNSYAGSFEFITYDLNGNLTFDATGELKAERITVD
jgi:hypothetical protein